MAAKKTSSASALAFEVSTGLKSVLGKDLITNHEVAIFELVKNSFDASATRVDLYFDADEIVIADNGTGMSYDDIKNKWLFVAYSSKRDPGKGKDFRDEIAQGRHYAGSKGIGRFSTDRLGEIVELQTRPKSDQTGAVHFVRVDWTLFDANHKQHFDDIKVTYKETHQFDVPKPLSRVKAGTVITIKNSKVDWNHDTLTKLKSALAKLINPFGSSTDGFKIVVHAPAHEEEDKRELVRCKRAGEEPSPNAIVNGEVGNFIFTTLQGKTTSLSVHLVADGKQIESELIDRGELIYRIREANPYRLLRSSGFRCSLFFLNQSAKATFTRRMGVPPVQFGSVFLFRNGFRIFPVGEEGDDWFGMDRRKQQGYARFLGTRDIIGRLDVSGTDDHFQETSSRNAGLIETDAVVELRRCFMEHCLKRLEKYVVPVTFIDKGDKHSDDVSRLLTDPGRARVAAAIARLVDSDGVELVDYSKRLIKILSERSAHFEESLSSLRAIAEKTQDKAFLVKLDAAEKKFIELRRSEEIARKQADEERAAKEAAQARAATAEQSVRKAEAKLDEERKRNLFLSSIATLDTETILSLHHQVTIYAVGINQQIENFLLKLSEKSSISKGEVIDILDRVSLLNRKVMGISKFATKANFRLESERIKANLGAYISEYISDVARVFNNAPITIDVDATDIDFVTSFKPIDVSLVIDNLVANARKARATRITFKISQPEKDSIHIDVSDNGRGLSSDIDNRDRIFEKGFSTTDGSGLGLYHVRHVLGEMNGTIEIKNENQERGLAFLIRISK